MCFERQLSPEKPIFFPTLNLWFPDIRELCEHTKRETQHIQIAIPPPTLLPTHPQLPIKSAALRRADFLNTELCEKPLRHILLSTPPDNLFRYEWSFQPIRRKKKKLNISGNKIPIHTQSLHFQHYFHVPVRTGRRRKKPEPSARNLSCPTFLWAGRAWCHLWGKAFQHHPPAGIWDVILESQAISRWAWGLWENLPLF